MGTRLSVNINDDTAAYLNGKKDEGITATETIRRAIAVYKFYDEAIANGCKVVMSKPDGTEVEMRMVL